MSIARTPYAIDASSADVQRVLRNTYLLLAISMLPTALGAWFGVASGINLMRMGALVGTLVYLGVAFGLIYAIRRTMNSAMGVVVLLAFTGFMGFAISGLLSAVLMLANGVELIMMAAGGTGIIFASLATLATVTRKDFGFMGKFLFIGLILLVVASLANMFLQIPALQLTIASVGVLLFSGYILYDVSDVVNGGERNYISATLRIYLDIINLFVSLLQLLSMLFGERR